MIQRRMWLQAAPTAPVRGSAAAPPPHPLPAPGGRSPGPTLKACTVRPRSLHATGGGVSSPDRQLRLHPSVIRAEDIQALLAPPQRPRDAHNHGAFAHAAAGPSYAEHRLGRALPPVCGLAEGRQRHSRCLTPYLGSWASAGALIAALLQPANCTLVTCRGLERLQSNEDNCQRAIGSGREGAEIGVTKASQAGGRRSPLDWWAPGADPEGLLAAARALIPSRGRPSVALSAM